MLAGSPHGFDANPFADDVESTWVAYDCGWSVRVPVAEIEDAPDTCPICGARRVNR